MAIGRAGKKSETAEGAEHNQPGTGRIEAFSDPKGNAVGNASFLVEDYVPERLDVQLKAKQTTLKSGVSATEFERYFADSVAGPLNRHIPGVHAYLLKGERGARVGGYVIVYEFQSLARRNAYFPRADTSSAMYQRLAKALPANSMENLSRYVDVAAYTDYVVVR